MRSLLLAVLAGAALGPSSASAQEPLFLRIRPNPAPEAASGGADRSDAAVAAAAHEAVWERANRRARIAIASVCTGCLPPPPRAVPPAPAPTEAAAAEPPAGPSIRTIAQKTGEP
ncbi:hypothetical protein [Methylobacterium organophilum]|uniref:Uncharacterized protein n=1 Tax=Methylobacterium organophilum TaxID=410 RepID=A0ABQ4T7V6_METOR|nr:hypothetical protein [Methylobacterium organophilum]GJE27116.1 hypothetical protein LKMONMHP_1972 [Methylobacterium organophilum]